MSAPADLEGLRRDGWCPLGRIADPAEIEALLAEERRFRPERGHGARANATLRVATQLCDRSAPVRDFCTRGRHLEQVSRLLGPDVCFTHMQFVTKLPDRDETHSEIPWHQDNGYGRLEPPIDLTVFLALTAMDERNGALQLVPGSHRLGLLEHERAEVNPVLRELAPGARKPELVTLDAGFAIAFSGLLVHASGPNRSAEARIAFYVRYCAPHVRMISGGGEARPVLADPHSWMVRGEAREPG